MSELKLSAWVEKEAFSNEQYIVSERKLGAWIERFSFDSARWRRKLKNMRVYSSK
ncbi:MAG: hypothetical protein SGJ10_06350 [Bacteroidota bacterium]|nr:hypothetical protein [Bacteroidota bacterium]